VPRQVVDYFLGALDEEDAGTLFVEHSFSSPFAPYDLVFDTSRHFEALRVIGRMMGLPGDFIETAL